MKSSHLYLQRCKYLVTHRTVTLQMPGVAEAMGKAGVSQQKSKEKSQQDTHTQDISGMICSLLLSLAWIA